MPDPAFKIRWAPRVAPGKIRRLYEIDALGIADEELIAVVGFGLYARCQSILAVSAAVAGRVECPRCAAIISCLRPQVETPLACRACGWTTTWGAYHATWQHQELYGGGAVDAFAGFVAAWPAARTPQAKMLLIDRLIHVWHWQTRQDHALGRPAGVNLIEGSRQQVLALLDGLTLRARQHAGQRGHPHGLADDLGSGQTGRTARRGLTRGRAAPLVPPAGSWRPPPLRRGMRFRPVGSGQTAALVPKGRSAPGLTGPCRLWYRAQARCPALGRRVGPGGSAPGHRWG